jgi:protein-S-isoprenylcysteine O-methyltransferase Ste14
MPGPHPQGRLVTQGIYAWIRHPLYSAVGLFFMGFALQSGSGLGVAAALLLGLFLDAKSRFEERLLRARFPDYEAYARKVRRFLPGLY